MYGDSWLLALEDQFIMHTNAKSLSCTLEINIILSPILQLRKGKKSHYVILNS